jgi:hypothetical protein
MKLKQKWAVLGVLCALLALLVSGDARACTTCTAATALAVGANDAPKCAMGCAAECPCCPTQALTGPAVFADLKLAGAVPGVSFHEAVPVVEGKLTLANLLGPLSLNVGARHFFSHDDYWRSKARMTAGFDVPVGNDCKFFGEFRRSYYTGDEWTWAGLAFKFGP